MDSLEKRPYESHHSKAMAKYEEDLQRYKPSAEFLKQKTKADITAAALAAIENEFEEVEDYFSFVNSSWMTVFKKGIKSEREIQEELWRMWSTGRYKKKPKKYNRKAKNEDEFFCLKSF